MNDAIGPRCCMGDCCMLYSSITSGVRLSLNLCILVKTTCTPNRRLCLLSIQVAVLSARLEGKDLELESIKEENGDMLQKVGDVLLCFT